MKKILNLLLVASFILGACTPEVEPLHFTAPVVEFEGAEVRSVSVGEPETFSAKIVSGDGLTIGWYVDGLLESSNSSLTYVWHVPGDYEVKFMASNGSGAAEKVYEVNVSDELEIFLTSESVYEVKEGEIVDYLEQSVLKVGAVVVKGSNVSHEWKVNGVLQDCREAYFDTFSIPAGKGSYAVSYKGENSVGKFERQFKVNVLERELTIDFSETAPVIVHNYTTGGTFSISANILYGGTGAQHNWYFNGSAESISNDATFTHDFTEKGTYTLRYYCENSKGEKVEREWTINVIARDEAFLEDYEDGKGNGVFVQQSGGKLKVIANPYKSDANGSDYVLEVTGGGSGYFGFVYETVAKLGIDITQYDGIKVDMYIPESKFFPVMDYKGQGKVKANADTPYKYNEWVSLDYDLKFSTKGQLQPRPFVDAKGNGNGGGSVVYYDNVYLYKK